MFISTYISLWVARPFYYQSDNNCLQFSQNSYREISENKFSHLNNFDHTEFWAHFLALQLRAEHSKIDQQLKSCANTCYAASNRLWYRCWPPNVDFNITLVCEAEGKTLVHDFQLQQFLPILTFLWFSSSPIVKENLEDNMVLGWGWSGSSQESKDRQNA